MAITAEQLIAEAKEAADLTNVTDFVTDAQWLKWINSAVRELHRFVTNKFKATYFREYDFTLGDGESSVELPANFWRLRGLTVYPDTPRRRPVRPYNFPERDDYLRDNVLQPGRWDSDRRYNLLGSRLLKIQPQEHAAGPYRLYYIPKPVTLELQREITVTAAVDNVVGSSKTWAFSAGDFTQADVGKQLTVTGADEAANNASFNILTVLTAAGIVTDGSPTTETFDSDVEAFVESILDEELDPYSEYVWLCAAIKSLTKEESFAQANLLREQRNLIRDDLTEALEQDQGGPKTIIDTDDAEGP